MSQTCDMILRPYVIRHGRQGTLVDTVSYVPEDLGHISPMIY